MNKAPDGTNNICRKQVTALRKKQRLSQRELADRLRQHGLGVTKNAIQRIESGERFVTDIELKALAKALEVRVCDLV